MIFIEILKQKPLWHTVKASSGSQNKGLLSMKISSVPIGGSHGRSVLNSQGVDKWFHQP